VTHRINFALALALVATGCAHDPMGSGGDDGSGTPTPAQPDATGAYALTSTFDIASTMPSTTGAIVNSFLDATDDSDDPAKWLLQTMINALPNGSVKSALQAAAPLAAPLLNNQLLQHSPQFVGTILEVGKDMNDVMKHFGIDEKLEVTTTDQVYAARMTAHGMHFTIDNDVYAYEFSHYNLTDVTADGIIITVDANNRFMIGDHQLPLAWGRMLVVAMEEGIIPHVHPGAHNLHDLLADLIDCSAVGDKLAELLPVGNSTIWAAACDQGLIVAAAEMKSRIASIDDTALGFELVGGANASDTDHDGRFDRLDAGEWAGTMSYAGAPAPLAPASFTGKRQ
jgi:hypothetical protein